jgi:FecR protein
MIVQKQIWFSSFLAAFCVAGVLVSPTQAQNSGRVGAVNIEATGTPPGAASRTLTIGTNIIYKERVKTSAQGSTQILFLDTSTLNVGRNSNIVIDEYVYDPKAGTGNMVVTVSKGVARFVGGQISHTAGVSINTPVATLGIRGGVATVIYPIPPGFAGTDPKLMQAKGQIVIGHVGTITIKNGAGQAIIRPGYMTWVSGPNDPIPEPFPVPDFLLQKVMALLTSGPGQTGGVKDLPTDAMAARIGLGTTIVTDPAKPPGTNPLGYFSIFDGGNAVAKNKSQANQTQQVVQPNQPPPTCGSCNTYGNNYGNNYSNNYSNNY